MKKLFYILFLLILCTTLFSEKMVLQQQDVDLKDFIMSIGKILDINFLLPPNIQGKVNIVTNTEIKEENLLSIFETILLQNGFIIKEYEGIYEIIRSSEATRDTRFYKSDELTESSGGYITTMLKLDYFEQGKIAQLVNILNVVTSRFGVIRPFENYLVITDLKANINMISNIINIVDTEDKDVEFVIIDLKSAPALVVNQRLNSILTGLRNMGRADLRYHLLPIESTNSLIVVTSKADIETIKNIVVRLDADYSLNNIFKVFQLNYSNTTEIIAQLREIIASGSLAGEDKDIVAKTRIFEDARRNAIIVATGSNMLLEIIEQYIDTADTEAIRPAELTSVYEIKHIDKNDVITVLNSILASVGATLQKEVQATGISAVPGRNSIIVSSPSYIIMEKIKNIISLVDIETADELSEIIVYRVKNSNAQTLAEILNNLDFGDIINASKTETESTRFNIVPDKETNSLIITGNKRYFDNIKKIINELDIERKQVLIDVLIAEVSLDTTENIGVEWLGSTKLKDGYDIYGVSSQGVVDKTILGAKGAKTAAMALSGLSVGVLKGDGTDIGAIINLNRRNANFNILSTPQILTLDNKEAYINVGNQVPFLTHSRVTDQNTTITSFEYKNVGISLRITPRINQTGNITLEIEQEVKNLGEVVVFDAPIITTREISTEVSVQDGHTVIIGGLIKDETRETVQKVPILGDIPFLGLFFRRTVNTLSRTNLLVFINPRVIKDFSEIVDISDQQKADFDEYKQEQLK
jgi:general secretion pathway protein D